MRRTIRRTQRQLRIDPLGPLLVLPRRIRRRSPAVDPQVLEEDRPEGQDAGMAKGVDGVRRGWIGGEPSDMRSREEAI